jgi:chemotaxis protein MotB
MKLIKLSLLLSVAALLLASCVSKQKYNTLEEDYQQLNQSMSTEIGAQKMQNSRLQDSIKVSINSELLFPSGGWEMSAEAKETIAKFAAILAPQQTTNINVNGYTDSTPDRPGFEEPGCYIQPHPVAEAG